MFKKILLGFVLISVFSIGAVIHNVQKPNSGTISYPSVPKPEDIKLDPARSIATRYATFNIPGSAKPGKDPQSEDSMLYRLGETGIITISINFQPIINGDIDSVSSYNYRNKSPEIYSKNNVVLNTINTFVFNKIDKKEQTAYLLQDDVVASVSVATQSSETLIGDNILELIISNWKWQ